MNKEDQIHPQKQNPINKKISLLVAFGIIILFTAIAGALIWHYSEIVLDIEIGKRGEVKVIEEEILEDETINPCERDRDIDIKFTSIRNICSSFRRYEGKDYDFCENDYKYGNFDICYANVAVEKAVVKKDIKECEKVNYKDMCYSRLAVILMDESLCKKVEYNRRGECFINIATFKKNPKLCEKISYDFQKDKCYTAIALYSKNKLLCDNLKSSQWYINYCYREFRKEINWNDFVIPGLTEWNIYRNEKYGFEFKYPPNLLLIDTGKLQYYLDERDIFSISLPDLYFSVSVIPNLNIFCTNEKKVIGDNIVATTNVFSKMGDLSFFHGIWTNKNYGFVIEENHSFFSPEHYISREMRIIISEKIVNSFSLIRDVKSIECHNN